MSFSSCVCFSHPSCIFSMSWDGGRLLDSCLEQQLSILGVDRDSSGLFIPGRGSACLGSCCLSRHCAVGWNPRADFHSLSMQEAKLELAWMQGWGDALWDAGVFSGIQGCPLGWEIPSVPLQGLFRGQELVGKSCLNPRL